MDTIILRNITVAPQDSLEHSFLEGVQFSAQLIIEDIVHDTTGDARKEQEGNIWKWSEVFLVPIVYTTFYLGIVRIGADGIRTHQGAVEIIVERIEPHASKQETHFVVETSSPEDKDFIQVSFTAYSSTSNLAKGPSPQTVLSVVKSMDCDVLIALLTQIVISDTTFMNPDLGLLSTIHAALIALPNEEVHKPRALGLLANIHLARYDRFSEMMGENAECYPMFVIYSKGIDKAISMLDAALALASADHPKRPWMVVSLSICLTRKLMLNSSNPGLLGTTALKMSSILPQIPDDEAKKPILYNRLAEAFRRCFTDTNNASHLDLLISSHEHAVRLTGDDLPHKIAFLVDLIASLMERIHLQPQAEDNDRLVVLQEQLLSLAPPDFSGRLLVLKTLGHSLFSRYMERGDVESLGKSAGRYQEALSLLPDDHPERPSILNNLAASLSIRPQDPDFLSNLRKAIELVHQAICLTPNNDPMRPQFIANLGNSALNLFEAGSWDLDVFKIYTKAVIEAIVVSDDDGLDLLHRNFEKFTCSVDFQALPDNLVVEDLVPLYQSVIDAFSDHTHIKASLAYNLGCSLSTTFHNGRNRQLLDSSIGLLDEAIRIFPEAQDSTKRLVWTTTLSSVYLSRYIHLHDEHDWRMAEMLSPSTLQSLPRDPLGRQVILLNLGRLLFQRFCRTEDVEFLHRSIEIYRDLGQESQPETPRSLVEGSATLFRRFQLLGTQEDLDEAISFQERAVLEFRNDLRKKAKIIFDLSKFLLIRFHHLQKMDDLDKASVYLEDPAILAAVGRPDVKSFFNGYYDDLLECFQTFSGKADVEICIKELELITSKPKPSQSVEAYLRVHHIGMFLSIRLEKSNILEIITSQTFESLENSIKLFTDTPIDQGLWLSMLGQMSLRMFEQSHRQDDLEKAVFLGEEAIRLHRDDRHSTLRKGRQFLFILELIPSLHQRFRTSGELADINRSINILEDASVICPNDDPSKYRILHALGTSLLHRYDLFGDIFDLNKASHAMQEAMIHAPNDNPNLNHILEQNIGGLFRRRLKLTGSRQDAEVAVDTLKLSMQTLPEGSPEKLVAMVAYSNALLARFWHFRINEDLDEATKTLETVLLQLPSDSQQTAGVLHDLGSAFAQRFVQRGEMDDINRCISFLMRAKDMMPEDDPGRYMLLFDLGRWLPARYERLYDKKDLEDANELLRTASYLSSAPYMWRFRAASLRSYWTQHVVAQGGFAQVDLDGYKDALALLPKIAWLGMPIQSRQWHLMEVGDVVLDAVAAAIECSRYDVALEWLETGRSVTWGQFIDLRTPVDVLQASHPVLDARFSELSNALGKMESTPPQTLSHQSADPEASTTITPSLRYHELADEREKILQDIRTLDGFQNFLCPKSFSDLLEADFKGPIITLNVNKFRSDALVLMPDKHIRHISLDTFSAAEAHQLTKTLKGLLRNRNALRGHEDRAQKRSPFARRPYTNPEAEFEGILSKLWNCVAKPVLDGIGLTTPPKDPNTNLPRIWWCVTGPMILLPIHAAGLYGSDCPSGSKSKLSDFAISSYIPSLSALIRCSQPRQVHKKKVLAVALPIESALPCTQTEIELVGRHDGILPVECLIESAATYENVVRGLEDAGWVHFACHGIQDNNDPTQSALLLYGERKLTLSDLSKLSLVHAELAFLSACQTATGDELLPEEAVHLAAGMLLAGYQGVVGTMWSIPDVAGPKIANEFYTQIFASGEPDPARAAYALHASIIALRDSSDIKPSFFSWVPFVHYGL